MILLELLALFLITTFVIYIAPLIAIALSIILLLIPVSAVLIALKIAKGVRRKVKECWNS